MVTKSVFKQLVVGCALGVGLLAAPISAYAQSNQYMAIAKRNGIPIELAMQVLDPSGKAPRYEMKASDDPRYVRGQKLLKEYDSFLSILEHRYQVDREVLMGIWGIETRYGQNIGSMPIGEAMISMAAKRPDRRKFTQQQIAAAMRLAHKGIVDPKDMVGSWAGAMGHTQFIPTSYEKYAVDGNGDGKIDLWTAKDALASTANYLHSHGWNYDEPWGFEVEVPSGFFSNKNARKRQSMDYWRAQNVRAKHDGTKIPEKGYARIERYKGRNYMLFDNFYTILTYNASRDYAFSVSALGDQVVHSDRAGVKEIALSVYGEDKGGNIRALDSRGGRSSGSSTSKARAASSGGGCGSETCRIQLALKKRGFYGGSVDGQYGPQLQRAIAKWQLNNGMPVDGKITPMLKRKLR